MLSSSTDFDVTFNKWKSVAFFRGWPSNNSYLAQDKKSRPANTTIGSINIQSAKGNSVYLKQILDDCDILCIQEHWLLSLEKKILNNANEKYNKKGD
jgi:hypothetical protein